MRERSTGLFYDRVSPEREKETDFYEVQRSEEELRPAGAHARIADNVFIFDAQLRALCNLALMDDDEEAPYFFPLLPSSPLYPPCNCAPYVFISDFATNEARPRSAINFGTDFPIRPFIKPTFDINR